MTERTVRALTMVVLAVLPLPGAAGADRAVPERDGPYIVNDLAAAQAEARRTGKPIFVVFRCER